jgi:broad specificity phosphatase PhoE
MSLIYFIRHARTRADPTVPAEQWLLSEEGFVAAAALAGRQFWTTIDRVLTSTEKKSYATIAAALELWGLPHMAWTEFNEVQREGYTATQAEYEAQVRQLFAHPTESVDGWETADQALQRGMAGLNRALTTYSGQNIAIVGHGLLWAIVRAHLLGKTGVDPAEWKAVRFPDVMVWRVERGEWQVVQDFEGIRNRERSKE